MKQQKVICQDCQIEFTVDVEPNDDAWLLITKAENLHNELSADCKDGHRARIYPKEFEKETAI